MKATTTNRSLQELTTSITAFPSWIRFAEAMEGGYCPTLRTWAGRSKAQREWNGKVLELRSKLKQMGYPVFPETL